MNEQTISVDPNTSFKWPKGLRLFATNKVRIALPGALVKAGEEIGSIIEVSDDEARIGFQESADGSETFACIILELDAGASVRLHRASEALVFSDCEGPVLFRTDRNPQL